MSWKDEQPLKDEMRELEKATIEAAEDYINYLALAEKLPFDIERQEKLKNKSKTLSGRLASLRVLYLVKEAGNG